MEFLLGLIVLLLVAGVVLSIRQWRTGRGRLIDERVQGPQTEADRERIRAEDIAITRNNTGGADGGPH